jgi:GNAT superfamily N-acetyltransferase
MSTSFGIEVAGIDRISEVEPLYRDLHRHHRAVATSALVTDEDLSWSRRAEWYRQILANGAGFLVIARREGAPVGYAMVEIHSGPDDTWPIGDAYGEVQSLAVAPSERGGGLGGRLMDAVDAELARLGVHDLAVGVLAGNEDAIRFYERRGLRPGELQMWRFGDK